MATGNVHINLVNMNNFIHLDGSKLVVVELCE